MSDDAIGLIKNLQLNDGQVLEIGKDDIVVFVGPNNVGKSQSIQDIFNLCSQEDYPAIVIKELSINNPSVSAVQRAIQLNCITVDKGDHLEYTGLKYCGNSFQINSYKRNSTSLGVVRDLFVSYLDTEKRLQLADPPDRINRDEPKTHPIHYPTFIPEYRDALSSYFKRAFGNDLTPNIMYGRTIPLCIGPTVKLSGEYENEQTRLEQYGEILAHYDQVQCQGDGVRSFVGIILNLMIESMQIFLIDEPESFLHPPQARIIGQIIGEMTATGKQAFISTHSKDVIEGLLETCSNRVKIVRITREDDINHFAVLDNEHISAIWKDPLLRYSGIVDSMFHQSVVLCESDSDCKMYSIIFGHIKEAQDKYPQTQFVQSGGKHRLANMAVVLQALKVDYRVIADIDIIDDEHVFRNLIERCGGTWASIEDDYNLVVSNSKLRPKNIERKELQDIIEGDDAEYISDSEAQCLRKALSKRNAWHDIKRGGSSAVLRGDSYASLQQIIEYLKTIHIFIVPVGELESFIPDCGDHGPKWVNAVLEKYPDLDDRKYESIANFVTSWGL